MSRLCTLALAVSILPVQTTAIAAGAVPTTCRDATFPRTTKGRSVLTKCSDICPPTKTTDRDLLFCFNNCADYARCLLETLPNGQLVAEYLQNAVTLDSCGRFPFFYHPRHGFQSCLNICTGPQHDQIFCSGNCPDYYYCLLKTDRSPSSSSAAAIDLDAIATIPSTAETADSRKSFPVAEPSRIPPSPPPMTYTAAAAVSPVTPSDDIIDIATAGQPTTKILLVVLSSIIILVILVISGVVVRYKQTKDRRHKAKHDGGRTIVSQETQLAEVNRTNAGQLECSVEATAGLLQQDVIESNGAARVMAMGDETEVKHVFVVPADTEDATAAAASPLPSPQSPPPHPSSGAPDSNLTISCSLCYRFDERHSGERGTPAAEVRHAGVLLEQRRQSAAAVSAAAAAVCSDDGEQCGGRRAAGDIDHAGSLAADVAGSGVEFNLDLRSYYNSSDIRAD